MFSSMPSRKDIHCEKELTQGRNDPQLLCLILLASRHWQSREASEIMILPESGWRAPIHRTFLTFLPKHRNKFHWLYTSSSRRPWHESGNVTILMTHRQLPPLPKAWKIRRNCAFSTSTPLVTPFEAQHPLSGTTTKREVRRYTLPSRTSERFAGHAVRELANESEHTQMLNQELFQRKVQRRLQRRNPGAHFYHLLPERYFSNTEADQIELHLQQRVPARLSQVSRKPNPWAASSPSLTGETTATST